MLANMNNYYWALLLVFLNLNVLKADVSNKESEHIDLLLTRTGAGYLSPFPDNCSLILNDFADYAANFTKCSILNARPIRICEKCIEPYMNFHNKYQELMTVVVNGTSCKSVFISHDRLDAILEYHDNILSIWNKAHCSDPVTSESQSVHSDRQPHSEEENVEVVKDLDCYNWTTPMPVLSNETIHFNQLFNETINCIVKYINPSSNDTQIVCDNCMQSYLKLDSFYKTLSADSIGTDSICMDIVDSMNATRSVWSKSLNCCKIRRTPEVIFLVCTGIISVLPIFYYLVLRFCSPMRDLPNVLKQSRFKQTILRSLGRTN